MHHTALHQGLLAAGYVADPALLTTLWLAQQLERPLLLEGDAGVGKTSVAAAWSTALARRLVRLQCYEGLDLQQAVYEWNYGRQLLQIRLGETKAAGEAPSAADLFGRDNLLERPLLAALTSPVPCVLLIDEIDRADEAFEAYLLEALAEFQITIPELGTVPALHRPLVVLTSNATRELSDALRRRCLYHVLEFPAREREIEIVRLQLPAVELQLIDAAVDFVQRLRQEDLRKTPGIAETLDWVRALHRLELQLPAADPQLITRTLSCLLKTREDYFQLDAQRVRRLLEGG
jgi:MoxR-like ATPase